MNEFLYSYWMISIMGVIILGIGLIRSIEHLEKKNKE